MHTPYVFPQESGGRADVQWLLLMPNRVHSGQQHEGLKFAMSGQGTPMQVNVSVYDIKTLAANRHQHTLVPDAHFVHVHLDVAHLGVGGDDSWSPTVHKSHLVPPSVYNMEIQLSPT